MAEINSTGYTSLRNNIDERATRETWNIIAVTDGAGTEVVRLSTSDSRVSIVSTQGNNPYQIEVTLTGGDADITTPQDIGGSKLYREDTNGEEVTTEETTSTVTLENDSDEVVVTHDIEAPQIQVEESFLTERYLTNGMG